MAIVYDTSIFRPLMPSPLFPLYISHCSEYTKDDDIDLVIASVRAIGHIIVKVPNISEDGVDILMGLLQLEYHPITAAVLPAIQGNENDPYLTP